VLLYTNYYRFGQTLLDKVALMSQTKTGFTFEFTGEENLHSIVHQKKGGILLSAHVGNWEAAGHMLKRLDTRINILMYDGEDTRIKKYLDEVTGERNFNIIYVKDDLSHIYRINEALSANEIVCMHADRFLEGNKTLSAEFFGEKALFPEGPFLLSLKLKVPVAFVHSFKESSTHYHFYSTELKYFYADKSATVNTILKQYASNLEEMVKKYPEQWFNYYNFWQKKG
jgi:predicted LPLAT superfamily acyltransferase